MKAPFLGLFLIALVACSGLGMQGSMPQGRDASGSQHMLKPPDHFHGSVQNIIVIVMENRTVDNLFNGLPGADTVQSGLDSNGNTVALQPVSLTAPYDLDHRHSAFLTEYDSGKMDGFDKEKPYYRTPSPSPSPDAAYGYVPQSEVQPYFAMATQYAFADRMFQTNEGPSLPAHQYLISATAAVDNSNTYYAMDNPNDGQYSITGGCDSPKSTLVALINPQTNDQSRKMFPCFDHLTLMDLLDQRHVSWRYYQPKLGPGLWYAPDAISHIRYGRDYQNVVTPTTQIISDIRNNNLPNVSWVIPTAAESDHARITDGSGPAFVSSIVNAVGNSQYWDNSVIFVVWDDWGGWYDHVAPTQFNYYEMGMRVPLIAISPFANPGYVSHVPHEFASILNFIEEQFNLPCTNQPPNCGALGYSDTRADDLGDMFNIQQHHLQFKTIKAPPLTQAEQRDTRIPDDD
ncbi:MAG: hypothetical protein JO092_08390 [Candidatus Eremiobacteraeota bacterium]|nr:hypothetical protein [Candidatus Eremiobacteraeota bacterium]